MRDMDLLRIRQLEDSLKPFTLAQAVPIPQQGWIRALRETLGMTTAQLARRLGKTAAQSIADIQSSEAAGTIKLNTLRDAAEAMGCRLVYALVPVRPIEELRRQRAGESAQQELAPSWHSMRLEAEGLDATAERRARELLVERLLRGRPQRLWD